MPDKLITIEFSVIRDERTVIQTWRPELEVKDVVTRLGLFHNGESILSVPFYFHDDVKYLHTMCSRQGVIKPIGY